MKRLLLCTLCVWIGVSLNATSIVPYNHLGQLSEVSHLIVMATVIQERTFLQQDKTRYYYDIQIEEVVKGSTDQDLISIQRYKLQRQGMERKVFGDLELIPGQSYLLFLNHLYDHVYRPQVMNYYVFEEIVHRGKHLLAPTQESAHLQVLSHDETEPLKIYNKERLLNHLKAVSTGADSWSSRKVVSEVRQLDGIVRNERPGHCNNYYDEHPTRWQLFDEGRSLPIYIDPDIDEQKANTDLLVEGAINALLNGYTNTSLSLEYAGSKDFDPCTSGAWYDNSANGYFFQQWADTTIGQESIHIMFNDPCGELPEFRCGGKGTIAFGGLYRTLSETHQHEGQEWFNGYLGFVLLAKGAGCVSDSKYQSVLMHEITHALSLGHIHGSGTALMNPRCCTPITELDQQCMSSLYFMGRAKIEEHHDDQESTDTVDTDVFITLSGHSQGTFNQVKFSTKRKSEWGVFSIERSTDGRHFTTIETIRDQAHFDFSGDLISLDRNPLNGLNVYRVVFISEHGQQQYSNVIRIYNENASSLSVQPNPAQGHSPIEINIQGYEGQEGSLSIYDITGRMVLVRNIKLAGERMKIVQDTSIMKTGAYYVIWKSDRQTISQKILKA